MTCQNDNVGPLIKGAKLLRLHMTEESDNTLQRGRSDLFQYPFPFRPVAGKFALKRDAIPHEGATRLDQEGMSLHRMQPAYAQNAKASTRLAFRLGGSMNVGKRDAKARDDHPSGIYLWIPGKNVLSIKLRDREASRASRKLGIHELPVEQHIRSMQRHAEPRSS